MADSTPKSYHSDPTLWLYTSLSSGSSHIVTATSRLETILKANKIPFQALDVATDEKARMLWGRRAGKRKLPGLVRMGMVVGDLDEVEEWNEYGEIQEQLASTAPRPAAASTPTASTTNTPSKLATTQSSAASASATPSRVVDSTKLAKEATSKQPTSTESTSKSPTGGAEASFAVAMRQAGFEAAEKANKAKTKRRAAVNSNTTSTKPAPSDSTLSKLGNSTLPGVPPPSGSADSTSAGAPETTAAGASSRNDAVSPVSEEETQGGIDATGAESPLPAPTTPSKLPGAASIAPLSTKQSAESAAKSSTSLAAASPSAEYTRHRGSSVSMASPDAIREVEEATKIEEEPEKESDEEQASSSNSSRPGRVKFAGEAGGKEMDRVKARLVKDTGGSRSGDSGAAAKAASVTDADAQQDLPGKKTQEQRAADGRKAGDSVAD